TDASGRSATQTFTITVQPSPPIVFVGPNSTQSATVGQAFSFDATRGGAAFSSPSGAKLSYTTTISPASSGLTAVDGKITGTPTAPGIVSATVTARDVSNNVSTTVVPIVVFSSDLVGPVLPTTPFLYADADVALPAHFAAAAAPGGSALVTDNTPAG